MIKTARKKYNLVEKLFNVIKQKKQKTKKEFSARAKQSAKRNKTNGERS